MATLRDLRKQAKELGLTYEKETSVKDLEEMIAARLCEEPPAITRTPIPKPPAEASTDSPPVETPEAAPVSTAPKTKKDKPAPSSFQKLAAINIEDLSTEFQNQPVLFATYAEAEAVARTRLLGAKLRMELVEAELGKKFRTELTADGAKATEKMIQSEVLLSEEYQTAQEALIAATEAVEIARAAKDTFVQRKDMLIQLGAARRQEYEQTGMAVKSLMTKAA